MAGLTFPVLLVFVQLGLSDSMLRTATSIYDGFDFHLVLVSPQYVCVWKAGRIPRVRLLEALSVPQVRAVAPLYVGYRPWRNPATGTRRDIFVIGTDVRRAPFSHAEVADRAQALHRLDAVLIDRLTRPEYGPRAVGMTGEMGGQRVQIVGEYTLGAGFAADGTVIVNDDTFARLFPLHPLSEPSAGLLRLDPGSDPDAVVRELRRRLPPDVRVWSRHTLAEHERAYWSSSTSIGLIFGAGVAVAFAVLTVMMYQLLSTDITKRLREYATMKAIGFAHAVLLRVVLQQALILSGLAFAMGFALSLVVYHILIAATNLPIVMTATRALLVFGVTLGLAMTAALLASRRLRAADPADLF